MIHTNNDTNQNVVEQGMPVSTYNGFVLISQTHLSAI